jgi:hypothetical protein
VSVLTIGARRAREIRSVQSNGIVWTSLPERCPQVVEMGLASAEDLKALDTGSPRPSRGSRNRRCPWAALPHMGGNPVDPVLEFLIYAPVFCIAQNGKLPILTVIVTNDSALSRVWTSAGQATRRPGQNDNFLRLRRRPYRHLRCCRTAKVHGAGPDSEILTTIFVAA